VLGTGAEQVVDPWAGTEGGQFRRSALSFHVSANPREAAFLRPVEAAELAGLSTKAIYRAIERGEPARCAPVLSAAHPSHGV
jgi:hypothetical protein